MTIEEIIQAASEAAGEGSYEKEFDLIQKGLRLEPDNYELYYMLGEWYFYRNIDLSYLCFEHAGFYAEASNAPEEDLKTIHTGIEKLKEHGNPTVKDTSIVILSYNDCELMKANLEAIRKYTDPKHTKTIVVDNASTDGVAEWLSEQPDILCLLSKTNDGFSKGCNKGFSLSEKGSDILFLNNDAVLTPNSLFWLRMALYTSHDTGMVSGVTNSAVTQEVDLPDTSLSSCMEFGRKNNIPDRNALEARARLTGFALLLKHTAIESILINDKDIFDTRFSPAYFEDDDLGLRLSAAGWKEYLVHNAFIYHKGGAGFDSHNQTLINSREKFREKWGFDMWAYELPWDEAIETIDSFEGNKYKPLRIFLIGSGIGTTLGHLKWLYPNSTCVGWEEDPLLAGLSRFSGDIICDTLYAFLDKKGTQLPLRSFDYILADLSSLDEELASKFRVVLSGLLARDGRIVEHLE
ncbi:MAG: glycosyltransferase [Lachnospiraceae bacterium]|nr:glycosyltransferase [Lachnospiraceae bacterium]